MEKRPLSLKNNGHLSLFPVGTGSAFTKKLYQNNVLLIKGDQHIMVDCGTRTPEAFYTLGVPITTIENFLVTHSHADHIGGLEEVMLMGRYVTKKKPNIIITPEYQKMLWEYSLRGGAAYNERNGGSLLHFDDFFTVYAPEPVTGLGRDAWRIEYRGFSLTLIRTMHYPDSAKSWRESAYSIGLVIDDRIFFTGDTRFDPELIHAVVDSYPIEWIFHDVQFFPGGVHTPFDDLLTLPDQYREVMHLMHYPDTFQEKEQLVLDNGFAGFVHQHHYYDFPAV
ncbi:hypothetical protein DC28_01000 [Spirochaeta lutea]|uniref:Metallo-beta-lactamase domain-containing protein n=1 Tax=Spirochaeta lutea TaxID=1480694 RepID=A0A098R1K8_9SPIO|nr:hypothetical protein DC28_01000 [Spirochaeta lutea]